MTRWFVAVPALLFVYAVSRWFDGRDSQYGPGAAWNIGHLAFLGAFVGFACLVVHFLRVSRRCTAANVVPAVAAFAGVALFYWVILTDLIPALDDAAALPDPLMAAGPILFTVGFSASLALHARQQGLRAWWGPPALTLIAFPLAGANLDLLPVTATLVSIALIWVGLRTRTHTEPAPPDSSAETDTARLHGGRR